MTRINSHLPLFFQIPWLKSQFPPINNGDYVKSTTFLGGGNNWFYPYLATDHYFTLIDQWYSWVSQYQYEQRFHIDLGSVKIIKRIYYENCHSSGLYTTTGVQNFTFWGSNDIDDFNELAYIEDGNWVQLITSQSTFDEHVAINKADPKYISVTNNIAYRYYAFKFADTWGSGPMGVRRIELQGY